MLIFNRITLAATCFSLSVALLNNQAADAQALVLGDKFDAAFLITSSAGQASGQQAANLTFGQADTILNSNYSFLSNLKLSTNIQQAASNSYDLNFSLTTGSNSGFIPPNIGIGQQFINQWTFDLGNFFDDEIDNGINFLTSVTYNSAQGSWFDDGQLVLQNDYLPRVKGASTPTELVGQFLIFRNGDLGAFGNGIDTFALKVNVTPVPEPSTIASSLLACVSLGLKIAQQRKSKRGFVK